MSKYICFEIFAQQKYDMQPAKMQLHLILNVLMLVVSRVLVWKNIKNMFKHQLECFRNFVDSFPISKAKSIFEAF